MQGITRNTSISAKTARAILTTDIFYVIPKSVALWLNQLPLTLGQRLITERIISKAILRPIHEDKLKISFSLSSLARDIGGCDKKTVMTAVQKLQELGIISVIKEEKSGTLYEVHLPEEEIRKKITVRKKPVEKFEKTKNQELSVSSTKHKGNYSDKEKKIEKLKNEAEILQGLLSEKMELYYKINDLRPGERIGIKRHISKEEMKVCDEIADLSEKIRIVEGKIKQLQSTPSSTPSKIESTPPKTKSYETRSRFIRPEDVKSLKTRLDKLKINQNPLHQQTKDRIFHEIIWAIRFGYLASKGGSTYYLINYALKLVKDNSWRTPIGFEINQIIRFTRWVLNGGKKEA